MKLETMRACITNRLTIMAIERYIRPKEIRNSALKRQKLRNRAVPAIKEVTAVFFPILIVKRAVFFILKVL
ncbi:hypothetical protein [Pedobacter kyonggii]|uniref:Uncharacterized protein n=1 Tax=Pedobacter kyonggii TaxID=1926871 RepID=A0A4Q9HG96_9SPHI|nr:hypothetical protein [Pedobacter kyonggii]TBO44082.1 hypothetical protein EYS08_05685 [Pedobacter kyonggii]